MFIFNIDFYEDIYCHVLISFNKHVTSVSLFIN